ncbi:MAG: sugar ABC transporter ATP-binding protein [Chitinophagaceae bacterium]|nr:MAG: sugar ABC transporter ATP-binding protein [Chitinophagaceae bacterium]
MLRLQNISKSFGGIKALQDVSIAFNAGEVHALCGENGAGKSTLMNIIMGNIRPDKGLIFWKDKAVMVDHVLAARKLGISIVYQERSLANALSVAENIYPVAMPLTSAGLINYPLLYSNTHRLLNDLGLNNISPKTLVSKLSVAQMQMVEIAKAIAQNPALLILDEPTASISTSETKILFRIVRQLKNNGTGVIYISHRMDEIMQVAQKVSVLKDGKYNGTVDDKASTKKIISMMVGRELASITPESYAQENVKLEVKNYSGRGFSNISFRLHKGEVLGFAGLEGSGRTSLAKALFGYEVVTQGNLFIDGRPVTIRQPSDAMKERVVYLPEDRKSEGLFPDKSVAENIFVAQLKRGLYSEAAINKKSKQLCEMFGVRTSTVTRPVRTLSGGNQQKVMLVRSLALDPEIFIINEPTHGVDAGAKADIYPMLKTLTRNGNSILLISGDLTELLLLCDRILVMHDGKIQGILLQAEATEEKITTLASGFMI